MRAKRRFRISTTSLSAAAPTRAREFDTQSFVVDIHSQETFTENGKRLQIRLLAKSTIPRRGKIGFQDLSQLSCVLRGISEDSEVSEGGWKFPPEMIPRPRAVCSISPFPTFFFNILYIPCSSHFVYFLLCIFLPILYFQRTTISPIDIRLYLVYPRYPALQIPN